MAGTPHTHYTFAVVQHMKKNIALILITFLGTFFCNGQVERNNVEWQQNDADFELKVFTDYGINPSKTNTELILCRNNKEIFADSISINNGYFKHIFNDMNSDGHDDILIYQGSGARANETYNLYLYQSKSNDYKKVIGFNESPNFLKTDVKGIITSMILTANVDYEFYFLKDNAELIDLKIRITDEKLDGIKFRKAIKKAERYVANKELRQ
jgi:hypothetical protein